MDAVIKVENLGKKYLIRHERRERYTALRDVITNKFKSFGKKVLSPISYQPQAFSSSKEEFWALRDVSFEIKQGDRVGIIGRNGAGKTTLLKLLSRITEPTTGRIELTGRVASLLEVGTGFHPELTGRENIFLNGAILGMGKSEIKRKFDEIVAFAEIDKFLDTPVKRYSSGMYVRLAFAVAAHLEPEILIVDEVLAVGDIQFQKKCLGKMGEIAQGGRTILFVSHNMGAVLQLCERGIHLSQGLIVFMGTAEEAVTHYIGKGEAGKSSLIYEPRPDKDIQITGISVLSAEGAPVGCLPHNQPFFVNIEYRVRRWPLNSYVTFDLFDQLGTQLLWSCDVKSADEMAVRRQPGIYQASVRVPEGILNPGVYNISSAVYSPSEGVHDVVPEVISLELSDGGTLLSKLGIQRSPALIAISLDWTTKEQY